MPPEGELLTAEQIATLRRWIEQGAPWPGQMEADDADPARSHWSLQAIAAVAIAAPGLHPIDALIERRLREVGLSPSPPAEPRTLLRRVSLILTGLPPTPAELDAFLQHPGGIDAAYAEAVDRLLDSPRYGERWAQHWLDVIRWAETVGFETNLPRPRAWPYRDWVIESLNQDKPYDQFVFEQVAGDTVAQDAALGFLVAGPANLPGQVGRDEEAMRQARQDELDEVIGTVSQAFLGLTVGCARCHNHKFDPITQRDYYAMQAMFAALHYGERRWRGDQDDRWTAEVPAARNRVEELSRELESLRQTHQLAPPLESLHSESFEPTRATAVRMEIAATGSGAPASLYELQVFGRDEPSAAARNVALATGGATASASSFALANQTRHFDNLVDGSSDRRQAFPWEAAAAGPAWVQVDFASPVWVERIVWDQGSSVPADYVLQLLSADSGRWISVADTGNRLLREDDTRGAEHVLLRGLSQESIVQLVAKIGQLRDARAELNRLAAGPQVFAASFAEVPETTWLLHRGDPMQRRDVVLPAIPRVLGDLGLSGEEPEPQRRQALARHLTSPSHPLTARVIVNRVWQHHFGAGLVDTPSDFGRMGTPPVHPALLDWLASDFIAGGWSLKRLHRQIALSRTFRQSSHPRGDALALDVDSRWLWRFPPRRLEAEAIRDSILQVSGKLNLEMGGPGFDLFQQRGGLSDYTPLETFDASGCRRMIYAHKIRMQEVDIFGAFDCPDAGQMKPKRTQSITPTQSLSLFNSPLVMQQAEFFAQRIRGEVGEQADAQVDRAFRIALARGATDSERVRMVGVVTDQGLQQLCRVLFNTSEFLYVQ